jgi:lipoate-protein ligase A
MLHVLRDPPLDGPTNMARDEHLVHCEQLRPAALRIYAWNPPTLSLGYFQCYEEIARLPPDVRDLAVVRRPTGGGAIVHDREVTYCLALDDSVPIARQPPVALYRLVHEAWRAALAQHGQLVEMAPDSAPLPTPRGGPFFCFAKPGRTDLVLAGKKLLGSAQRRVRGRVLQHGSLLLGQRFASHPGADLGVPAAETVISWIDAFIGHLGAALQLAVHRAALAPVQLADVARRREKYAGVEWTRRF